MTPLSGFTPDVDPATPGVIVDATNVIPHPAGMKGSTTPVITSSVRNLMLRELLRGAS